MPDLVCENLAWDSEFFGLRIARLLPRRLTVEIVEEAETWCRAGKIDCLYFLADSDDPHTVRIAEDRRFRFLDVRVTLARPIAPHGGADSAVSPEMVRAFRGEDMPALRRLARASHRDSRFYADPMFPDSACDALYETWIEKSCAGYADAVFVAEVDSAPAGYATVHRDKDSRGRVGLIAVDPGAQKKGLGKALAAAMFDWCRRESLQSIGVVTQGRNIPAQRLYARCGFLPESFQFWYHRWFAHPCGTDLP